MVLVTGRRWASGDLGGGGAGDAEGGGKEKQPRMGQQGA